MQADRTIYALFKDRIDAETVVNEMALLGIRAREISILLLPPAFYSKKILGALSGLVATIRIKGTGSLLVGGPLEVPLSISGTSVSEILVSLGLSEKNSAKYYREILTGSVFLAIPATEEVEYQVMDILEALNAYSIHCVFSEPKKDTDYYHLTPFDTPRGGRIAYATLGAKGGSKKIAKTKKGKRVKKG